MGKIIRVLLLTPIFLLTCGIGVFVIVVSFIVAKGNVREMYRIMNGTYERST